MPYINLQVTQGVTRAQKAQIVAEMTDTLVRVLGKRPEHTHIVIQEIATDDWGFAGELTTTWRAKQARAIAKAKNSARAKKRPAPRKA
jgi:4-oxalocrotonate tautomerase